MAQCTDLSEFLSVKHFEEMFPACRGVESFFCMVSLLVISSLSSALRACFSVLFMCDCTLNALVLLRNVETVSYDEIRFSFAALTSSRSVLIQLQGRAMLLRALFIS